MPLNDTLRHRTHAFASSINSHRVLLYSVASLLAVSIAIIKALRNYSNFYSVAISLSKSSRSVLALANFGFLVSLFCGHLVQRIFFGTLRANEVERLYDRLWFFITESLLAFTIFRDEFDFPFALMFGFLLFVKSFHWLANDRIEWMDQRPYPGPSPLFHVRMTVLFILLWMSDLFMFLVTVENTIANGVGGMVLFASEYGILMASILNTISKYLLSTYELRRAGRRGGENAPPWENKSMWTFYIELVTDFLKLTTYLVFFTIIIAFYGLPLNIIRDVYITARSFVTRLRALHRYQAATRNMDQRYPNATGEELTAMSDHTCIICREEMVLHEAREGQEQAPAPIDGPNTTPKKLPCGHIFHFHCLRSWLERQQSCPTCRRTVLDTHPSGQDSAANVPAPGEPQRPNNNQPPVDGRNQNNPRVNNPLGNPLGLVGRLFGAQPPAPNLPGQVLQNPVPQQILAHQNTGNAIGQLPQGVVIQYHIQYQPPRNHQSNNRQPLPPQPPLAAPQFQGFTGPGGAWHAWPRTGDAGHNQAAQAAETGSASTLPAQPTRPPHSSASASVLPPTLVPEDSQTTAREAAASAALRRLNGNNNRTSNSNSDENQSVARNPSSERLPDFSHTLPNVTNTDTTSNNIPTLIPLYDYPEISRGLSVPSINGAARGPLNSRVSTTPREISLPSQTAQQHGRQRPTPALPPTLTSDQLALMDRLTRDAIDERLRVLEGVSGTIYGCIDDLMRMRSVLPSMPSGETSSIPPSKPDLVQDQEPSTLVKDGQAQQNQTMPGTSGQATVSHDGQEERQANSPISNNTNTEFT